MNFFKEEEHSEDGCCFSVLMRPSSYRSTLLALASSLLRHLLVCIDNFGALVIDVVKRSRFVRLRLKVT